MYSRIGDDAGTMRTSIEIDDRLMLEAMRCSGARTKKAVKSDTRLAAGGSMLANTATT